MKTRTAVLTQSDDPENDPTTIGNRAKRDYSLKAIQDNPAIRCGSGYVWRRDRDTGRVDVFAALCHKWICPRCGPRNTRRWAKYAAAARPERMITYTCDPKLHESAQTAEDALRKGFARSVALWRNGRKKSKHHEYLAPHVFEYQRVLELQKSGMPHYHVLQKGDYIPKEWISKFMEAAGVGKIVHITRLRSPEAAAHYVTKYTLKTAAATQDAFPTTRLISHSRNFSPKAADPDDLDEKPNADYGFSPRGLSEIAEILIRGCWYKVVDDGSPWSVAFDPTREDLPPDAIAEYLGPNQADP